MSVLRNIAARMASRIDDAARLWLPRPLAGDKAGDRAAAAELALVRKVAVASLFAFPCLPIALSSVLPVSLALPVGAALAAAATLVALVAGIAIIRLAAARATVMPDEACAADRLPHYDGFAGLVTVHDPRGSVTSVRGRDAGDFLAWMRDPSGRGFIEQIHISDRIIFLQAIDRLRQGSTKDTIDIRMERADIASGGQQFMHMRCEMTALVDDGEPLSQILVQSTDVSTQARLRADAAEKTALAESANDAKTRFLAAVSHELRTPLNAILGFSEILSGEYFGKLENDRQREYVALIHQSGAHLLSVVNTMLDMSKIEAGRYELIPEPFRIGDTIKACEAMLGLQAEVKGVKLTSRMRHPVGEINADQRAIQQILINLVGNAVKFTETGGLVTIDADIFGGELRLVVSDTGIGIPENRLSTLGQPFVQIENAYTRKYEGTGLGLSLVKGLVALHGGSFSIRSRPGEGTVITVTIPADGSGIRTGDSETDIAETMVEFPPRLKAPAADKSALDRPTADRVTTDKKGAVHDAAQAKTA